MSDEFKMANTPRVGDASDSLIEKLFADELKPAIALAAAFDRIDELSRPTVKIPELFFSTQKRRDYVFEQVPLGHDLGWRCYDPEKYDGDPADGDTTCGYGKSQDEAYVDYLHALDDNNPKPRSGIVVHSSPHEPPTIIDVIYRDPDEE